MTTTVKHSFRSDIERYSFDYDECSRKFGYAQIDTRQDASYFGTWANPFTLTIVCYAEGDISRTIAATDSEFTKEIRELAKWNEASGWGMHIDGMCDPEIIAIFELLGLHDLLH